MSFGKSKITEWISQCLDHVFVFCFFARLMTPFMKALQRMHKDHINAVLGESTGQQNS